MTSNLASPKDTFSPNNFVDRNYQLNLQSFVPFSVTQQQWNRQQQNSENLRNSNKTKLTHLNISRELPQQSNEYNSNDDEDVDF